MLGVDPPENRTQGADMQMIIYEPVKADMKAFVDFWSRRYTGYDDDFYQANVGQELTEARIMEWFAWKNGTPLSILKDRESTRLNCSHANISYAVFCLRKKTAQIGDSRELRSGSGGHAQIAHAPLS